MKLNFNDHLKQRRGEGAFTFVDLIVTLAVIGLIGVMIIPAFGRASATGSAAQCLNNFRQLGVAWAMYSNDTKGDLIESHPFAMINGIRSSGTANPYSWAPGYAGNVSNIQTYGPLPLYSNTNRLGLTQTVFYKYYNNIDLLKCPSDQRMVNGLGGNNPILRSYSMNNWMNGGSLGSGHRLFTKQSHVTRPDSTFVMIDEDAISIDDSYFLTFMDSRGFVSLPARRHNFGYTMNFADGHSSVYKLRDPIAMYYNGPPPTGSGLPMSTSSPDYIFHTNRTTYASSSWEN